MFAVEIPYWKFWPILSTFLCCMLIIIIMPIYISAYSIYIYYLYIYHSWAHLRMEEDNYIKEEKF